MSNEVRTISKQKYDEFQSKYGIDKLIIRIDNGKTADISELEKKALACVDKAGMFTPIGDGEEYSIDEKLYALYFAIHHFMETGGRLEAFDLYCIYSGAFLNDEGNQLQNMMNFVASYENGAARLVQKHRDHYVHSAYVFILGLAMFQTQGSYREAFSNVYFGSEKKSKDCKCYLKFVELWGLTALFHDIGYQYEIPFNQISENNKFDYIDDMEKVKTKAAPVEKRNIYFHYRNMGKMTELKNILLVHGWSLENQICYSEEKLDECLKALVDNEFTPKNIEDVFAYHIKRRLSGRDYLKVEAIAGQLRKKWKPKELRDKKVPGKYDVYMDHAYYSGIRLFKQMIDIYGLKFCTNKNLAERMDAITAIVMHNKFFEICLSNEKEMSMQEHPLAYLLILCDELQCWNRTSYGKSSLTEFHAKDCEFEFCANQVTAKYCFDIKEDAIQFKNGKIANVVAGPLEKFLQNKDEKYIEVEKLNANGWKIDDYKTWGTISSEDFNKGDDTRFLYSIHKIVDCSGHENHGIAIQVSAGFSAENKLYCREYLTTLGMDDLYNLAELHYSKAEGKDDFSSPKRLIQDKLHDVMMVRALGRILNAIGCVAMKEQKALERVVSMSDFTDKEIDKMCNIMVKCQEAFIDENEYIFGTKLDNSTLKKFSEDQLRILLDTVLNYPGLEVYRIW